MANFLEESIPSGKKTSLIDWNLLARDFMYFWILISVDCWFFKALAQLICNEEFIVNLQQLIQNTKIISIKFVHVLYILW